MSNATHITLSLACDPHLARIVRMNAANVATLSNMSVERVEDIRMAAEEAFIYACASTPGEALSIAFDAEDEHVSMTFELACDEFAEPAEGDMTAAYADLILGSVCDAYDKRTHPAVLLLDVKADV